MLALRVEKEIGGRLLSLETGKLAKQADASVLVRYADTVVLVAVCTAEPRAGIDFFPLTVDYREKTYAAGKFPGGFFKREGRPTLKETLTMRLIDRPARPLFPKDYFDEVQIHTMVLSADQQNDPDLLAMIGASAALALAPIPWNGPFGCVRIGRVEGELVVNPTHAQREYSELDMVLVGPRGQVNMIEVGARQVPEETVMEAVVLGQKVIDDICDMIAELVSRAGKPAEYVPAGPSAALIEQVAQKVAAPLRQAKNISEKQARNKAVGDLREQLLADLCGPEGEGKPDAPPPEHVKMAFDEVDERVVRRMILDEGLRPDGRAIDEIRPITCEVGVLPRTHGSAIFTRGQTQALVVTTLGTPADEQIVDGLIEEYAKKFMLHYNFPPFSVGEVRPIRGPSRREMGHGALAEKCLEVMLPNPEQFPYTIRLVADILESNGSSSMASVCGGSLALMDAGVPVQDAVAGISIGLVSEGDRFVLLTDIQGEEDRFGDMDFKVAGTQHGITGIQLDLKTAGISHEVIRQALAQAKQARLRILKDMLATIAKPRPTISEHAPRIITIKINPEKIGKVIGPGGKTIKRIQDETGTTIDIDDDGTVYISGFAAEGAESARDQIQLLGEDVQLGKIYNGKVISIKEFGAFIELIPGQDGLCHVSELADHYVKSVSDEVKIGDQVRVKVIAIDDQGRVKLSRKQVLVEERRSGGRG